MEIQNFFGNPEDFKKWIESLSKQDFLIALAKKEEQWAMLTRCHNAYSFFLEDANDAYERDALCMKYLYDEKKNRAL